MLLIMESGTSTMIHGWPRDVLSRTIDISLLANLLRCCVVRGVSRINAARLMVVSSLKMVIPLFANLITWINENSIVYWLL